MAEEMGMTNKQFQGFVRLILNTIQEALKISPDNEKLESLANILQDMLEDS